MISLFSPPPLPSGSGTATHRKTEKERRFADGRGGRGEGRSQITRWRENLVLYSALNSILFQVRHRYGGTANIIILCHFILHSYATQSSNENDSL
jgi:hypothetical protein